MSFWSVFLIGIALSFDGAAVAAANGARHKNWNFLKVLKIGLFFGCFHFLMVVVGELIGSGFSAFINGVDHWVAFVLLVGLGLKMLWESFGTVKEKQVDIHDLKILLLLSVATSIDALVIGISFAFVKVNFVLAALEIGLIIFFITIFSVYIGKKFGEYWGKKAEIVGGFVLLAIGIKILVTHLL